DLPAVLDGSENLRQRPMSRVIAPLCQMGANIHSNGGKAPITNLPRKPENELQGIRYKMPVPSAQVKSALLIASLSAKGQTTVIETGPSRDHTERMLKVMGANLSREKIDDCIHTTIEPRQNQPLKPIKFQIPGDFSSAAFIMTAALLLPGSKVMIQDTGLNWTRTGYLDVMMNMGADLTIKKQGEKQEKCGDIEVNHRLLQNVTVSGDIVVRMIDEFPAFAVLAAFSQGECILRDAQELRLKESDRIKGIYQGLSRLGIQIEERQDGFRIVGHPDDLEGNVILNPGNDHRMAMAFVLAGLRAKNPIIIENSEIIHQSFPGFIPALQQLGAESLEVIHD
ncbi:MAG: 3-phosphoshikimate 1-carboxyvinyltransferase, partial [Brevefilum sp.]